MPDVLKGNCWTLFGSEIEFRGGGAGRGVGVGVDRNPWHFQIIQKNIFLVIVMGHLWVMSDPMDLNGSITNT